MHRSAGAWLSARLSGVDDGLRTLKSRPAFPDRFGSREHGLSFLRSFFARTLAAFHAHPARFKGRRVPPQAPTQVWINPPVRDRRAFPAPDPDTTARSAPR